jgi:hypothetical protein
LRSLFVSHFSAEETATEEKEAPGAGPGGFTKTMSKEQRKE